MDYRRFTMLKKAAEEARIGDPIGKSRGSLVSGGYVAGGALTGFLNGLLINNIAKRLSRNYAGLSDKARAGVVIGAAILGAGAGAGLSMLHGTGYNYSKYKIPKDKKTVVIAFSGAMGGDWQGKDQLDVKALNDQFGKGNYALFSYRDLDAARAYMRALPKGTPIRIVGHSMGGPIAYKLALAAAEDGIPIKQLDTLDPVGKLFGNNMDQGKPATTEKWNNWYPEKRGDYDKPNGNIVATLGGALNETEGATNHAVTGDYSNHSTMRYVMNPLHGRRLAVPDWLKIKSGVMEAVEA